MMAVTFSSFVCIICRLAMQQSEFIGPARKLGDQPVVVLRGDANGIVKTTYLVRLSEIVINYGGIRYEQNVDIPSARDKYTDMGGFFFFNSVLLHVMSCHCPRHQRAVRLL